MPANGNATHDRCDTQDTGRGTRCGPRVGGRRRVGAVSVVATADSDTRGGSGTGCRCQSGPVHEGCPRPAAAPVRSRDGWCLKIEPIIGYLRVTPATAPTDRYCLWYTRSMISHVSRLTPRTQLLMGPTDDPRPRGDMFVAWQDECSWPLRHPLISPHLARQWKCTLRASHSLTTPSPGARMHEVARATVQPPKTWAAPKPGSTAGFHSRLTWTWLRPPWPFSRGC